MNSVLDRIRGTLETMCHDQTVPMEGVWYGACKEKALTKWNYFVFNRSRTTKNGNTNKRDLQTFYYVHIIHEDYIPEGYVESVVAALEAPDDSGTKLRITNEDILYDYVFKGSTNMVVEIAHIPIYHPEKRC